MDGEFYLEDVASAPKALAKPQPQYFSYRHSGKYKGMQSDFGRSAVHPPGSANHYPHNSFPDNEEYYAGWKQYKNPHGQVKVVKAGSGCPRPYRWDLVKRLSKKMLEARTGNALKP